MFDHETGPLTMISRKRPRIQSENQRIRIASLVTNARFTNEKNKLESLIGEFPRTRWENFTGFATFTLRIVAGTALSAIVHNATNGELHIDPLVLL